MNHYINESEIYIEIYKNSTINEKQLRDDQLETRGKTKKNG